MDSIRKARADGIPSWQKAQEPSTTSPTPQQSESTTDEAQPPPSSAVESTTNEAMKVIPAETATPIVPHEEPASTQAATSPSTQPPSQPTFDTSSFSSQQDSPNTPHSETPPSQPQITSTPPQVPTSTPSTAPPIITYPENLFSLSHPRPNPLITPARLTTATYILGILSATIYGTSRFLVNPMINTLASARQEFAGNALQRVEGLNSRLEGVVSQVPPRGGRGTVDERAGRNDDDATACFTQSEGTQTADTDAEAIQARTTTLSSTSSSSSSSDGKPASSHNPSILDGEVASLTRLQTLILQQKDASQSEEDATDSIHSSLSELRAYLFKLEASRYTTSSSSGINGLSGYGSASLVGEESIGGGKWASKKGREKEVKVRDQVKEMRKTIGEVKSVLLSAKNFPGGRVR